MVKDRSSDEILFAGEPPLKRYISDCLQQVIERGLESPLTDEQRALFEAQLIDEWQRGPESRAGIESTVAQFKAIVAQIGALPLAKQPLGWREYGRHLYMYAEKHGKDDPVGQLILETYQSKHTLLVTGNPPLSRQAAESYVEMSVFFHGLVTRSKVTLTPEKKAEIVNEVSKLFRSFSPEAQDQISQADILWGVLRYNWQRANRDEREQFRQELLHIARSATPQPPSEAASKTVEPETMRPEGREATESEAGSASPVNPEALAKNSKFIEAVKKLRLSAAKGSPFQFRRH